MSKPSPLKALPKENPDEELSPCQFGAVYDGQTDCTDAIQACLNQRGTVRLRGTGTALISRSLVISSETCLSLDPEFTIRLADNACCTMLCTRWADQRYLEDQFPDFVTDPAFPRSSGPEDRPENWTLGEPEQNISVTGGVWDANGGKNPRLDHLWGSFQKTARNGQFFYSQGSIRHLVVSNVNIRVADDTPLFGRGLFTCVGDRAAIVKARFCNLAITAENKTRYDVAFQGNWQNLKLVTESIEADIVFDLRDFGNK